MGDDDARSRSQLEGRSTFSVISLNSTSSTPSTPCMLTQASLELAGITARVCWNYP